MSRSRIRHRGEPARDIDHGPANGAGGSTLVGAHAQVAKIAQAQASRVVEVGGKMPDGGASRIERSMATEAQREAWRAEPASPARVPMRVKLEVDGVHAKGSPEERAVASKARQADHRAREAADRPAMGSAEHLHASRMRGGERNRQLVASARVLGTVTGPTVTAHTLEEEPAMAIEPPPIHVTLQAVADAATHAAATRSLLDAAIEHGRAADRALAAAEQEWDAARDALEVAWRATRIGPAVADRIAEVFVSRAEQRHEQLLNGEAAEPVDDAPEVVTRQVVESGADHAATIPVAVEAPAPKPEAGGGPEVELPRGQREVLAAVTKHQGDRRKAAEELHRTVNTVEQQLEFIGRKGLLPSALIATLPARFAKYSPAGV